MNEFQRFIEILITFKFIKLELGDMRHGIKFISLNTILQTKCLNTGTALHYFTVAEVSNQVTNLAIRAATSGVQDDRMIYCLL